MTRTQALLICLLGVIVLSPDALLIRLTGLDAFTVLFWRGVMQSLVILTALYLWRGNRLWSEMRATGWRGFAYAALFGFTASGFVYATVNTTVANTLFIVATSPIWAALLGAVFLKERITRATALTIGAVLCGMALIAAESWGGAGRWQGDVAALMCAVLLAAALTIARSVPASLVPMAGAGGFAILGVGFVMGGAVLPAASAWPPLLAMGLIVVPLSFSLITWAARSLPPSDSALIMLLEAPFGLAIVWAILGEQPGPLALIGGCIVLGSLAVSNIIRSRG
ncbi:MAG: DMT family transporter [Pseudomonadota bacterium]